MKITSGTIVSMLGIGCCVFPLSRTVSGFTRRTTIIIRLVENVQKHISEDIDETNLRRFIEGDGNSKSFDNIDLELLIKNFQQMV